MLALLATLPIVVVGWFLVVLRWPASRAMPLSWLTAAALALLLLALALPPGIGRATADVLAEQGDTIVVAGVCPGLWHQPSCPRTAVPDAWIARESLGICVRAEPAELWCASSETALKCPASCTA